MWGAFIVIVTWLTFELIFYLTHQHPLNNKEIESLSRKRKRKFIPRKFNFTHHSVFVNQQFKSSLRASGRLYTVDEPLYSFPSIAALLLKGKKHEWILVALSNDEIIKYIWANKGYDSTSVGLNCNWNDIIEIAKEHNLHSVLVFHNHPNSNPGRVSTLIASKQDLKSADFDSKMLNPLGINLIEFVCSRGRFLKYYQSISDSYIPEAAKIENIRSINGMSEQQNYKLHRELGLIFRQ